ncbi:uncharacterized protein TNCV_3557071 [Trichonephila clavipes]|uniref:Mos1 transposase HTH domain-containing protein n=1 Tax=Trichonephila clavipes TaxID=2585209 RepID=A0A8X6WCB5_TRICX|nr:uncharacterized protein TNCV_3557071 [Trichonephila clavipes]
MSAYEPNSRHLREVLIFCFNMKKSASEAHRMLSNTYDEDAIKERTFREWFQLFKNGDFDVENQHGNWWDQVGIAYYELLKPTGTITGGRYRTVLEADFKIMYLGQVKKTKRSVITHFDTTMPSQSEDHKTQQHLPSKPLIFSDIDSNSRLDRSNAGEEFATMNMRVN